jgi:hypothetical protein
MNQGDYGSGIALDVNPNLSSTRTNSRAPSLTQFSINNDNSRPNQNILNTSNISFDILNGNPISLKTRYDVKSLSGNSSLYGSKVIKFSLKKIHFFQKIKIYSYFF